MICLYFRCRLVDLSTRYRENLQLVIKDLNLTISPGEKVNNRRLSSHVHHIIIEIDWHHWSNRLWKE